MKSITKLLLVGLVLVAGGAQADIIYDNGGPDGAGAAGITAGLLAYDDFVLDDTYSVTDAHIYVVADAAGEALLQANALEFAILGDAGGLPDIADVFATGPVANTVLTPDGMKFGLPAFQVDFDLVSVFPTSDIKLGPGVYWFTLFINAGNGDEIVAWLTTAVQKGSVSQFDFPPKPASEDLAFYLTGYVPVPGVISLLLIGLVASRIRPRS